MSCTRRLLAHRHLAVLLCVGALLLKLLVPTGYMIASDRGRLALTICSGMAPRTTTAPTQMPDAMAMPAMHGDMAGHRSGADHGDTDRRDGDHGKAEMPCAFAGMSAAMLGAIDPVQLSALIAFVMEAGRIGVARPLPTQPSWLRPPLRGPPAHA